VTSRLALLAEHGRDLATTRRLARLLEDPNRGELARELQRASPLHTSSSDLLLAAAWRLARWDPVIWEAVRAGSVRRSEDWRTRASLAAHAALEHDDPGSLEPGAAAVLAVLAQSRQREALSETVRLRHAREPLFVDTLHMLEPGTSDSLEGWLPEALREYHHCLGLSAATGPEAAKLVLLRGLHPAWLTRGFSPTLSHATRRAWLMEFTVVCSQPRVDLDDVSGGRVLTRAWVAGSTASQCKRILKSTLESDDCRLEGPIEAVRQAETAAPGSSVALLFTDHRAVSWFQPGHVATALVDYTSEWLQQGIAQRPWALRPLRARLDQHSRASVLHPWSVVELE